jgi:hypothetical protein
MSDNFKHGRGGLRHAFAVGQTPDWPLIGIWRWLAAFAVFYTIITGVLLIDVGAMRERAPEVIALALVAFAAGSATIAALAFWARDRYINHG